MQMTGKSGLLIANGISLISLPAIVPKIQHFYSLQNYFLYTQDTATP